MTRYGLLSYYSSKCHMICSKLLSLNIKWIFANIGFHSMWVLWCFSFDTSYRFCLKCDLVPYILIHSNIYSSDIEIRRKFVNWSCFLMQKFVLILPSNVFSYNVSFLILISCLFSHLSEERILSLSLLSDA